MIDSISIKNFQSLVDVNLDLQPLTVIVGASSSGKSAFIRALRALAGNRRGTEFITHGERTASISAHLASRDPLRSGTVTLTRSTQSTPNSYTLIPDDPKHPHYPKAEFTKLGGDVPPAVAEFIGIPAEQIPLAIASQFDKPYLLDAPGAEVARTFGALTNADIILNGARESNRQKLTASQTLRTRAADLEAIKARVPEFQALKAQRSALDTAEALIEEARDLEKRVSRLAALTETVTIAEQAIPALAATVASIAEPEDLEDAISAYLSARKRHGAFVTRIQAVSAAQRDVQARRDALTLAGTEHDQAVAEVRLALTQVADGFESYFREHGALRNEERGSGWINVNEAANLAARFMAQLDS